MINTKVCQCQLIMRYTISLPSVQSSQVNLHHQQKQQRLPSFGVYCTTSILNAGKFVKQASRTKTVLNLELFDLLNKEWKTEKCLTLFVDDDKFASGAFRGAFKGTPESGSQCKKKWVIKKYNDKSKNTIVDTIKTTVEIHTRKQVQMHTVARQ